jgi:1-acyl-sn-glycerol-3-phosphate acyltransferase
MTNEKRLEKALAKIEIRKQRLREKGITEPSKFGYVMRDLIAPLFRFGVSLLYPKRGNVHLGNTTKKDIKRITKGMTIIYAPCHRGIFDVAKLIAYVLPHNYLVSGDERSFYCTIIEPFLTLNGVIHFDRKDPVDSGMIIERATRILKANQAITIYPEGTPNVYSRDMLKLFPGVIKIALDTDTIIIPVGNQIDVVRHKKSGKIISDVNYTMYEDYNEQELFRPSDDVVLSTLHSHLKDLSYIDIVEIKTMEQFIHNGKFVVGNINFDLEELLNNFLLSHPKLNDFVNEQTREYLIRCAILYEYNKMIISSLNILESRMVALSNKINTEINRRNPKCQAEHERDRRDYVEFCLDVHERVAKKGRSNDWEEFGKYINRTTDKSVVESVTKKVMQGLEMILQKA